MRYAELAATERVTHAAATATATVRSIESSRGTPGTNISAGNNESTATPPNVDDHERCAAWARGIGKYGSARTARSSTRDGRRAKQPPYRLGFVGDAELGVDAFDVGLDCPQ